MKQKRKVGWGGHRSRYLSLAKGSLYHLSYTPTILRSISVYILDQFCRIIVLHSMKSHMRVPLVCLVVITLLCFTYLSCFYWSLSLNRLRGSIILHVRKPTFNFRITVPVRLFISNRLIQALLNWPFLEFQIHQMGTVILLMEIVQKQVMSTIGFRILLLFYRISQHVAVRGSRKQYLPQVLPLLHHHRFLSLIRKGSKVMTALILPIVLYL